MTVAPFITRLSDIGEVDWLPLNDVWVSSRPLWDNANGVFAELTYALALISAKAFGARLPQPNEIVALNNLGFQIPPVTLPPHEMTLGMSQAEIDVFRDAHMGGLDWAKLHTKLVLDHLAAWDG